MNPPGQWALVRAVLLGLLLLPGAVQPEPAPWYLWRSKLDHKMVCAQTSPGPGWDRAGGPFMSSRC